LKARRVKKLDPTASLAENAARIIRVRLGEMRSFVPAALEPGASRQQHDMRIAAKRLRYILEATGFCFGRSAQKAVRAARDVQDLLGDLHDCDVMLPRIEAHVAELRTKDAMLVRRKAGDASSLDPALVAQTRHRNSYRGLEVLAVYAEARRQLLFDRFVVCWEEQERLGIWDRLERAVTGQLRDTRERRRRAKRIEKARRELEEVEREERAERSRRAAWGDLGEGHDLRDRAGPPGTDRRLRAGRTEHSKQ
jgi:hypothetical protein